MNERTSDPLVSIITVVLNCRDSIETTIISVLSQTYANIEYIIIDGGSSDGTLDIIRKYEENISYWRSEPDNGISDAFNKGIKAANGDFIQFVNADDWLSENQVEMALKAIKNSDTDFVFGDMMYHNANGKSMFLYRGDPYYYNKIRRGMPDLNHPTVLAKKRIFNEIGFFDLKYKIAMDYDWLIRAYLAGFKGTYAETIMGHMRLSGVSDQNYRIAYKETCRVSIKYGYPVVAAYWLYFFRIFKSFLRRRFEIIFPERIVLKLRMIWNRSYKQPE